MNLLCKSLFIKLDNGNVLTLNLEGKGNTWHCPSRSCDSDRMYRHRQLPLPSGIHNYYPQVFTILQKVGTKSIDKPWQNCARKLSEKQILLFRGSSVLRRLAEIHARWKVCKKDKWRWTFIILPAYLLQSSRLYFKGKMKILSNSILSGR